MSGTAETRPTLLVFHKLTTGCTYGVSNYSPPRLRRLIAALARDGWRFNPDASPLSEPEQGRGWLVIGCDDGYEHLADVLPEVAAQCATHPIVFVPTDLEGKSNAWDYGHIFKPFRHLSGDQIRHLSGQGIRFGSHGASHCDLTLCDAPELQREITDSRKRLQDWTGQSIDAISYPFGRYNRRVIDAVGEAGYRFGYTMVFPAAEDHDLARGRIPVYSFDTPLSVAAKLADGPARRLEQAKTSIVSRLSGGTVWLNRIRGRATPYRSR